jgi:hypothetical protein
MVGKPVIMTGHEQCRKAIARHTHIKANRHDPYGRG